MKTDEKNKQATTFHTQIGADKFTKVMRKAFSLANDVETSNRKRDRTRHRSAVVALRRGKRKIK